MLEQLKTAPIGGDRKPQLLLCSVFSAADEAWRLLASYLDRYPSANGQHHRCVINKLLSHGAPLPDWLVKSYKVSYQPMTGEVVTEQPQRDDVGIMMLAPLV